MKTNLILILLVIVMTFSSCDDNSTDKGSVVFHTDAQARVNCGPFDVYIYIDSDSIGIISEPYLFEYQPECLTTTSTLMVEKDPGKYSYTAIKDCGLPGEWSGDFEIISNQCTVIYLDILEYKINNNFNTLSL